MYMMLSTILTGWLGIGILIASMGIVMILAKKRYEKREYKLKTHSEMKNERIVIKGRK